MGTPPRRRLGAPLKRDDVARLVREKIADGTLRPGGAAPSGAALAEETGYNPVTCRAALRLLLADGTLLPGVTRNARLRVPLASPVTLDVEMAGTALARTLAARRRVIGLTQPELAAKAGVSVTTVGHAETGRVWQSRGFWLRADRELGGVGDLLRMYDEYQAALAAQPDRGDAEGPQHAEDADEETATHGDEGGCSCGACAVSVTITYCDGRTVEMRPDRGAAEGAGCPPRLT